MINIASIDGVSVNPLETYSYAASKAGLIHLTRRMSLRLVAGQHRGQRHRARRFRLGHEHGWRATTATRWPRRIPAGRIGTDEDMAGVAIYLASRAGDYVVGQTIVVDGGVTLARG